MFELCGVELRGPVLNGSGTYDAIAARRVFGDELLERFPFDCFVSKTITLAPRQGNPPPRLWETPAGLINSIGLPNKGLEGFLAEDLPKLAELPVPLCVSVMGFDHEELKKLVSEAAAREEVSLIELNFSCPNVETGLIMGADPTETAAAVTVLRPLTDKPLIVKLTPNATEPDAVARAAEEAGADAVSLVNTFLAMAIDVETRRPKLSNIVGGLSGPAIRPIAVRMVYECRQVVKIPIIGMGGIADARDAIEFIVAGASAVQVGTANFVEPFIWPKLLDGIRGYMERHRIERISDLVGTVDTRSRDKEWISS